LGRKKKDVKDKKNNESIIVNNDRKAARERSFWSDKTVKWDKLDNTANLFPVIVSETVSNVYRISVTLKNDIDPEILQKAVDKVLPYFDVFNAKLKKGIFWYYFETNQKPAPRVKPENTYPCLYIDPYTNNDYHFRVTYFEKRINLEIFHVLTDGHGAFMFLKEITYQYLRYKEEVFADKKIQVISDEASLDKEDSYIKNYKKSAKKGYKTKKAVIIKGEKLPAGHFGIIHGYIPVHEIKAVAKSYGVTINQYLIGTMTYAIYKDYLKGCPSKSPISTCVPVNLRPYFDSNTTKNFFIFVSAVFQPEKDNYTFEEVLHIIADGLKEQINKDNLERLFSYNVSSELNKVIRFVPRIIKNIAMKSIYKTSARANTTTITNMGQFNVADEYKEFIDKFHVVLSMSKGQNMKGGICSFGDTLVYSISSAVRETSIQKAFFRQMVKDGINVTIESNGVYYE